MSLGFRILELRRWGHMAMGSSWAEWALSWDVESLSVMRIAQFL